MNLLKCHPFAVETFFRQSLVLTFALPVEQLAALLPPPFTPDVFEDRYAFVAVAMVQTEKLRPKGFPRFLGNDFFLSGYRIFSRYTNQAGKRLRGLYILESQTDSRKMQFMGNLMTHYNYSLIEVAQHRSGELLAEDDAKEGEEVPFYEVSSPTAGFDVRVRYEDQPALPAGSPFADWKQARRFAGPLPFTLTYDAAAGQVLIVQGVRQNWKPRPVAVEKLVLPWLEQRGFGNAVLASAFVVENIPYYWKKGIIENWQP
ncbi:DUF2071 domain-containing protein [Neolewinella persica]|uniref:DUF2071 domain-containing protein n=1 Tax=Neolewinella persica TaxID=70998 RepID=UPI000375B061|nr:DUF2071 domain-containing protein [Neolewinella persica]